MSSYGRSASMLRLIAARFERLSLLILIANCFFTTLGVSIYSQPWQSETYIPVKVALSTTPTLTSLQPYNAPIGLVNNESVLTIDYGAEVGGFPFVEVSSVNGTAVIELKYSEGFDYLNLPYSDGPYTFTNGLSNTFRTEKFNITAPGRYEAFLLQGGLRWQTIQILQGGSVQFSQIGLRKSVNIVATEFLPGSFATSKQSYTDIWSLGGRAVQAACLEAGTQPSTWQITDQGVLIRSQQPAQSAYGVDLANYTLSFEANIVTGGLQWQVAANIGYGSNFVITTQDYSGVAESNTIGSPDLPANSLIYGYGWSIVNQTTLEVGPTQVFPIPFPIAAGQRLTVTTNLSRDGYEVNINGQNIATVSYAEAISLPSLLRDGGPSQGTWSFGAFQDQEAYFSNAVVTAANGTTLYSNTLRTNGTLEEYAVSPNQQSYCLDGPKRDRLVWTGDFVHTLRTLLSSTNRVDFVQGYFEYLFSYQLDQGIHVDEVPVNGKMGSSPIFKNAYARSLYSLTDYEFLTLLQIGDYYVRTGDIETLTPYWAQTKRLAGSALANIDPQTGLVADATSAYFVSSFAQNSTAATGLLSLALQRLARVASAVEDRDSAIEYSGVAANLSAAINSQLWSSSLGVYSNSLADPGNYSVTGIAFAVLSGAANASRATSSFDSLSSLFYEIGYKSSSSVASANDTQLSPFFQGFLLEALFYGYKTLDIPSARVVPIVTNLLDTFWAHMLPYSPGRNEFYTGATWEYLYPDGSPGIGRFTSLSHPWGSAPTYVLSDYVLGVTPVTSGFSQWAFEPVLGPELGLSWANGTVPTPHGSITAQWQLSADGKNITLSVTAPAGTNGTCRVKGRRAIAVNGAQQSVTNDTVLVQGGMEVNVTFA